MENFSQVPYLAPVQNVQTLQGEMTITGILQKGVEANCIVLYADNGVTYDLQGLTSQNIPPYGSRVQVIGTIRSDIISICQQGTPLVVRTITTVGTAPGYQPPSYYPPYYPQYPYYPPPTYYPPYYPSYPPRTPRYTPLPPFLTPYVPREIFFTQPFQRFPIRVPFRPFLIVIRRRDNGDMEMED